MKTTFLAFLLLLTWCTSAQDGTMKYPPAPSHEMTDTMWGSIVNDPYRPLETDNEARQKWIDAEDRISDEYIKALPHKRDMEFDLNNTGYGYEIPRRSGPYYIEQSYGTVYYKDYLRDHARVLYSASLLAPKVSRITAAEFSRDGKYCAFVYSADGSDWLEIRVLNMNTQFLTKEHIRNVRHSNVVWFQNGFFYRAADIIKNHKPHDIAIQEKVYYHKIETDPQLDAIAYEDSDYPDNTFAVTVTDDERFVILSEHFPEENKTNTLYKDYQKNKNPQFKPMCSESGSYTKVIGSIQDTLLVMSTNKGAYNGQLVEIDTKKPAEWGVLVENQTKYQIKQVLYAESKYFTILQGEFNEYIGVFSREGDVLKTMPLPPGSASEMTCYSPDQDGVVIRTCYYTCPPTGSVLSSKDYSLTLIGKTYADFKAFNYKFFLTHYLSRDSTLIPIYIVTSGDYARKGPGAALLNVYGALGASIEPEFNPGLFTFLNNGGIYAIANIRGGSSARKDWHTSGAILNKQKSIDDAYYAARFLVDSGFALPDKVAAIGGSDGALTIAAVINQHPGIFKAAILNAGLYDLMRYETYWQGVYRTSEYGSANDSFQFKNLLAYSPLHNIKPNAIYPSMLICASTSDDRMPPENSYKYAAALQASAHSKNPILLHMDRKNYHSYIDNKTLYTFLFKELDIKYDPFSFYKNK